MKIIKYESDAQIKALFAGRGESSDVVSAVREIIENVRQNGDKALFEYSLKFDKIKPASLEFSREEINAAYDSVDKYFIETLEMAKERIEAFHRRQARSGFIFESGAGAILGQTVRPLERAGVYVPGGTASYCSTVLMDIVPAKIAGVGEIVMATPPNPRPEILAAAKIAGADRVFAAGGAQAVAALAYGTETIPAVDKIVGPGNIYVATAKQLVQGVAGIDTIAGPSEILVIGDSLANPVYVAADLLSQAEHDRLASAVFVTPDSALAESVRTEVLRQLELLPRKEIAGASVRDYGFIIIAEDLAQAVHISNIVAPEHLELCVENPFDLFSLVKNAGSVFLGRYAPEALGDYFAGPNHTLPTSGTARFASPLSVDDFVKKSSFTYYTKEALGAVKDRIAGFAAREGLDGHAKSVTIRFEGEEI
ncbi:MAG: histidinol dehydrogenase [Oscillospiraceae bacterium]|jgi:histidinol dehydrogenase|nr:histidinol dehydrogenase [Oscillospiraceae bacterium]